MANLTEADVLELKQKLYDATSTGAPPSSIQGVLPANMLMEFLRDAHSVFKALPTLLELQHDNPDVKVIVVGDTHGQFHDVVGMLDKFGFPCKQRVYVFNGDYVDRGAWGLETVTLLLLMKLAMPAYVHLLRGNHESSMCTQFYGFWGELQAKYPKPAARGVYGAFKRVFALLPLACLIEGKTLVVHGGLFRAASVRKRKGAKPKRVGGAGKQGVAGDGSTQLMLGTLDDLRASGKGGLDPDGSGSTALATDCLWSDPIAAPGLSTNDARGVGLVFGPDITQAFLEANGLKLILRSHEGPDARDARADLPPVTQGHALDHHTPAGDLYTIFSAPDYPQFQPDGEERYDNLGSVAILSAPDYCVPDIQTFSAVKPRPPAQAYYDYNLYAGSDEDIGHEGGSEGDATDADEAGTATDVEGQGGTDADAHAGADAAKDAAGAGDASIDTEVPDAMKAAFSNKRKQTGEDAAPSATAKRAAVRAQSAAAAQAVTASGSCAANDASPASASASGRPNAEQCIVEELVLPAAGGSDVAMSTLGQDESLTVALRQEGGVQGLAAHAAQGVGRTQPSMCLTPGEKDATANDTEPAAAAAPPYVGRSAEVVVTPPQAPEAAVDNAPTPLLPLPVHIEGSEPEQAGGSTHG